MRVRITRSCRERFRRRDSRGGPLDRLRPQPGDAGISLVELMVSLVLFSLVATALATGLISAVKKSGNDRNRAAATNLAQREIEILRNSFTASESGPLGVAAAVGTTVNPNPLPGGTAGQPLVVDGRPYTVRRTIGWLPDGPGASACEGGAVVTYPSFSVKVRVTWPGLPASSPPAEANTLLTPPRSVLNSTMSYVAVKIVDAAGQPYEDRTVYLKKVSSGAVSSATSAADGCAVFGTSATGDHVVYLDEAGFVDISGQQYTSKPINITASSFQKLDFSYDREVAIQFRLVTDAGYPIPTGVASATFGSTGFTNEYQTYPASTTASTVGDLWPISGGYTLWAGSCRQSDPAAAGGSRLTSVELAPGGVSALVDLRLTPVRLTVRDEDDGAIESGRTVVAVPLSTEGCTVAEAALRLGTSDALGQLKSSLPAGTWMLTIQGETEPDREWAITPALLPESPVQDLEVWAR